MGELRQAIATGNLPMVKEAEKDEFIIDIPTLEELGFGKAVVKIGRAQKLKVAYAKYGFVTQESINKFNEKLRRETMQEDPQSYRYKQLAFYSPKDYGEVPPYYVLQKMKEAMADSIFDSFEIAKVDWKVEQKDPILFGRIEGCTDRFFIAQWDDDVKVEDIVLASER